MTAATPRRVIRLYPVDSAAVISDMAAVFADKPLPMPRPAPPSPLMLQALRLWPDTLDHAERNRLEWLRAVAVVRASSRGWRWESRVARLERPL